MRGMRWSRHIPGPSSSTSSSSHAPLMSLASTGAGDVHAGDDDGDGYSQRDGVVVGPGSLPSRTPAIAGAAPFRSPSIVDRRQHRACQRRPPRLLVSLVTRCAGDGHAGAEGGG